MSFRISEGFIYLLWGVQTVPVLHMFHTSSPRWAMGCFCLHTQRFDVRVFVQAQFPSSPYSNRLQMLLMPYTWVRHFLRMKTILHSSISSTRNTFLSGTSCTFDSPLCWCFLLLGLYGTKCITVSAQGDPLQAGVHGLSDGSCSLSQSSSVMLIGE